MDVAIVIGGGNIFRGLQASASGMDRAQETLDSGAATQLVRRWVAATRAVAGS